MASQQRVVRRTDDAASTKLRAEPADASPFAIDDVDGEETSVVDGETVTLVSEAAAEGFSLVKTAENRDGYILTCYLTEQSAERQAVEEELMPWERGGGGWRRLRLPWQDR